MASIKKNLSKKTLTVKKSSKIGIIQSEYNAEITNLLTQSCLEELQRAGITTKNIIHQKVPGAWELPIACQKLAQSKKLDAIITIGLVLRGDTPHFDFVASGAASGIMEVSLKYDTPILFGVLTTNTLAQAKARIKGGKVGDKGVEVAQAAIKMINLK